MSHYVLSQAECSDDDEATQVQSPIDESAWERAFAEADAAYALRRLGEQRTPSPRPGAAADAVERMASPDLLQDAVAAMRGPRAQAEDDAPPPEIAVEAEYDKQNTRVVFTINNPGDYRPVFDESKMAYLIWQLERGKQGTVHIQGYLRLKKKLRLRAIQPLLGNHAAILIARGNEQQCRDYCTKEDTRIAVGEEHGTFNPDAGKQGKRTDIDAVAADCKAGKSLREIAADHPTEWMKFHAGIMSLHDQVAPPPPVEREVQVGVFWGPTHTGKTHRVLANAGLRADGGIYVVKPGRGPWDRYRGEKTICFDEFNFEKWDIYEMNQYLDKWTVSLDCRFHDKYAEWTRVVICANSSPLTWWPNASQPVIDAFRRRLGAGCRHILNKSTDVSIAPPDPDFSDLIPKPVPGDPDYVAPPPPAAPAAGNAEDPIML